MPVDPDTGQLIPYTSDQIAAWHLGTRGIRTGQNPVESYSPDGCGCERLWLCDWGDRFDVIKHLCGEVAIFVESAVSKITRTRPQTHPQMTNWWCVKARVTGHKFLEDDDTGGSGNLSPKWDAAEITATYEQVPFRWVRDEDAIDNEYVRYVTQPGFVGCELTSQSQYVTYPGGAICYLTADASEPHNRPIQTNIGFTETATQMSAVWRRVPKTAFSPTGITALWNRLYADPATSVPWIGTTNSTALFGRPPGTCLLEGVEPRLIPDPTGLDYSWDIRYIWTFKSQTHYKLKFFDPKGVIPNAYYVVGKKDSYHAPADMGDTDSLFPLRDHLAGLFSIS